MESEWQLDNPSIALAKYYTEYDAYMAKKGTTDLLKIELDSKKKELSSKKSELESKQTQLEGMGDYVADDIDSQIKRIEENAQRKISASKNEFELKSAELISKKEKDLKANDEWLEERLKQLLGDDADENTELTDIEKKALEFEADRRQFIIASNKKINSFQDGITQENLDCKTIVEQWEREQDGIAKEFEPDIEKYKKIIDDINKKHFPDISQCRDLVLEKVTARDKEIGQLQAELDRERKLAQKEINGYERDYKQLEDLFDEKIRMAKAEDKPTSGMKNTKAYELNNINEQIRKVNNRVDKIASSINQKIDVSQSKHDEEINRAQGRLNRVIKKRDQELEEPTDVYNTLVKDRDGQINALQSQINQRESARSERVQILNNSIDDEKKAQVIHHQKVDSQIVEFAMSGDTCFSEVLDEAYAPFAALQDNVNDWMELLNSIKKDKMPPAYQKEHDIQKTLLEKKDYSELESELSEAQNYSGELSGFAKNSEILKIIGGVLCGVGIVLTIVLRILLTSPVVYACLLISVVGAIIALAAIGESNMAFASICRYISLAIDYQEFPSILSYSTQVTEERELEKIKNIGEKLYDIHYGRTEAQAVHDAKDEDIKEDYERDLKLITVESQSAQAKCERERDRQISKIRGDVSEGEARFVSEKEEIRNAVNILIQGITALDDKISEIQSEIENNDRFIDAFESNYRTLDKNLQDSRWVSPMEYTHGKLANDLYVISEKGEVDQYGHKKIYRISHNKKPLIITYNISNIGDGDASQVEEIGKIIQNLMFDMMYSVYRMNSRESYSQIVVDEVGGTNDLKNNNVKNAFNIVEVVRKVDDIRGILKEFAAKRESLAEKGTQIDDLNESKFQVQDRPEVYHILYIIFKPNERKSKLDEDIRNLIPECDKYGFLPVFVCENETWNREILEKDSMYKDINSLVSNSIVSFDGAKCIFSDLT